MKIKEWYNNRVRLGNTLILIQLLLVLVAFFLESVMGMPHAVLYLTDVITCALFILSSKDLIKYKERSCRIATLFVGTFILYTIFDFFINHQSVLYYIWGFRNVFRFYVFFVSCLYLMKFEMLATLKKVFDIFLYFNVVVCSWQFFILKLPMDNICGLFGITTQGSGYMNVLLMIVTVMAMVQYLNQGVKTRQLLIKITCCVYISVISELKAYFFELALITLIAIALYVIGKRKVCKKTIKTVMICVASMLIIVILTVKMNPEYWEGFFTPQGIWEEVTRESGYSASGDINRLNGIPTIYQNIFHGSGRSFIGYGLGNCDYSSGHAILTSPFYLQYESLHYVWILSAFVFLELGFIGLAFYIAFFALIVVVAYQNTKKYHLSEEEKHWNQVSAIIAVCCVFLMMYNSCLRMEASYMIAVVLAFPFIITRKKWEENKV